MAKIFPKRIVNCFGCGHIMTGYNHTARPACMYFYCNHPGAIEDMGFGTVDGWDPNTPGHHRLMPKVRTDHTKTIGNVKIPGMCPLQDTE